MRPLLPLLVAACLLGCPRRAPTAVAGSADAQMDSWSAELEELRSRAAEGAAPCPLAERACGVAPQVCGLASQQAEREDFQRRCGTAQEDCAQLRDACSRAR